MSDSDLQARSSGQRPQWKQAEVADGEDDA
jgi:hypothetical protein